MKIQYKNKVAIDLDPSIPEVNKVTDNNMNEIKDVVNTNADTLDNAVETLENYTNGVDERLENVETAIDSINTEIQDINTNLDNVYTKTETDNLLENKADTTSLNEEITARENADTNLQNQIDAITASSDVVDVVGTYQDLLDYDTQHLGDNDIIKVLNDSTHNNAVSYFRWKKSSSTWQYVGSEGPYYTKGETDSLLNGKVNKEEGKGLSENDFTNALKSKLDGIESGAQVNKIETIKVNNVTQTITNKTVNIPVPTKTSDINNDSGFITKSVSDLDNYTNNTTLQSTYQTKSNLVTSVSSSSTDTQYPSAKLFYDTVGDISTILQELDVGRRCVNE
mgnify:CR=1 FL=1